MHHSFREKEKTFLWSPLAKNTVPSIHQDQNLFKKISHNYAQKSKNPEQKNDSFKS